MSVASISDEELLRRGVQGARNKRSTPSPRWVVVMDTFALGSTYARELCLRFNLDPEEKVR